MAALPTVFAAGVVRVRPQITLVPAAASPWTRYDTQFLPDGSPTGLVRDGMLTLTDAPSAPPPGSTPRWDVVTADIDHGARRMQTAADAVAAAPADDGADAAGRLLLPALRSNGLALVPRGRKDDFDQRIAAGAAAQHRMVCELRHSFNCRQRRTLSGRWMAFRRRDL